MTEVDITQGVRFVDKAELTSKDDLTVEGTYAHSYENWGCYLKSFPIISPPDIDTYYVDVPARHGKVDLSQSLTGGVVYKNRKISIELTCLRDQSEWATVQSFVAGFVHGRVLSCVFDYDPDWYYTGRWSFDGITQNDHSMTLKISGDVYPFKQTIEYLSAVATGVISVQYTAESFINFYGNFMPVQPKIILTSYGDSDVSVGISVFDQNGVSYISQAKSVTAPATGAYVYSYSDVFIDTYSHKSIYVSSKDSSSKISVTVKWKRGRL